MAILSFTKSRPPLEVRTGANLMRALLAAGVPVASSCDGDGVCGKCRLRVVEGGGHLTKPTPREADLAVRDGLGVDERISCQTRVRGDVTVDAGYW